MKKGQITGHLVIYIMVVIIAGVILGFSLGQIGGIRKGAEKAEIDNFLVSLESKLKEQSYHGYGSVRNVSFSLPRDIERICFVDSKERFSPYTNNALTKTKKVYSDQNVFFEPSEGYYPGKIDYMVLNESENPLCIKVVNGRIDLRLTALGNNTLVSALESRDKSSDCVSVFYNGEPDEHIDIVFLGYGYDRAGFRDDVYDYVNNVFLAVEPFSMAGDKFNFYRIDDFNINCELKSLEGSGVYIWCDDFSVKKLASNCPNDYIFVLADISKASHLSNSVRSSSTPNVIKINDEDDRLVLLHEFGHGFADLADEYIIDYELSEGWIAKSPNCDLNKDCPNCDFNEGCPKKWKELTEECFVGCSTNDFSRGTRTSIMKSYWESDEFGVINEKEIKDRLGAYK